MQNFSYFVSEPCKDKILPKKDFVKTSPVNHRDEKYEFEYSPPFPGAEYKVKVRAKNGAEFGEIAMTTLSSPPNVVQVEKFVYKYERVNRTITFRWNLPCPSNGEVDRFVIETNKSRDDVPSMHDRFSVAFKREIGEKEYVQTRKGFLPGYDYTAEIRPMRGAIPGKPSKIMFSTPSEGELNYFAFYQFLIFFFSRLKSSRLKRLEKQRFLYFGFKNLSTCVNSGISFRARSWKSHTNCDINIKARQSK